MSAFPFLGGCGSCVEERPPSSTDPGHLELQLQLKGARPSLSSLRDRVVLTLRLVLLDTHSCSLLALASLYFYGHVAQDPAYPASHLLCGPLLRLGVIPKILGKETKPWKQGTPEGFPVPEPEP